MSVHQTDVVICPFSQFYVRNILEPEHGTVALSPDDHILIVGYVFVASSVFEHISESVYRFCTKSSGRCFEVLFCKYL